MIIFFTWRLGAFAGEIRCRFSGKHHFDTEYHSIDAGLFAKFERVRVKSRIVSLPLPLRNLE